MRLRVVHLFWLALRAGRPIHQNLDCSLIPHLLSYEEVSPSLLVRLLPLSGTMLSLSSVDFCWAVWGGEVIGLVLIRLLLFLDFIHSALLLDQRRDALCFGS